MPGNTERRFTLRALIQENISEGMTRIGRSVESATRPLANFVNGTNQADRALEGVADAATAAGGALDEFGERSTRVRQSREELLEAAAAARALERDLRAASRVPGISREDRQALQSGARNANAGATAAEAAAAVDAPAEAAAAQRRVDQAVAEAEEIGERAGAARARAEQAARAREAGRRLRSGANDEATAARAEARDAQRAFAEASREQVRQAERASDQVERLRRDGVQSAREAAAAETAADDQERNERVANRRAEAAETERLLRQEAVVGARSREQEALAAQARATPGNIRARNEAARRAANGTIRAERAANNAVAEVRLRNEQAQVARERAADTRRTAERAREGAERANQAAVTAQRELAAELEVLDRGLDEQRERRRAANDRLQTAEVAQARARARAVAAEERATLARTVDTDAQRAFTQAQQNVRAIEGEAVTGARELNAAAAAFERIEESAERIGSAVVAVQGQGGRLDALARGYRRLTQVIGVTRQAVVRLVQSLRLAVVGFGRIATSLTTATRALTSFRTLAILAVGALAVRQVAQYADSYIELGSRLRLITESQQELVQAQNDVFRVAQETRQDVAATADTYFRFGRSVESLRNDQERLANVTQLTAQAIAISATSAESAQAALFQFGQGLSADALRGQELNSVLEQTPRLAQALADGFGVPLGRLRQLAADGQLTAQGVVEALESQSEAIAREFATTTSTIGQAVTLLNNAVSRAVDVFFNRTGLTDGLIGVINGLTSSVTQFVDVIERRVGGLVALTSTAFDANAPEEDRLRAQAGLLDIARSIGNVFLTAGQGAAALFIDVLDGGVRAILAATLPTLTDFFRDQAREISIATIGLTATDALPGLGGSLSSQLRDAREEAARLEESTARLTAQYQELDQAFLDSATQVAPGVFDAGVEDLRVQTAAALRAAQDSREAQRAAIAEVNRLAPQVESRNQGITNAINQTFVGAAGRASITAADARANLERDILAIGTAVETAAPEPDTISSERVRGVEEQVGIVERLAERAAGLIDGVRDRAIAALGGDEDASLAGAFEDFFNEFQPQVADIEARQLEALGQSRDAARLRLVEQQRAELTALEGAPALLRTRVEDTQVQELDRFDLDTGTEAAVRSLTQAQEDLQRQEEALDRAINNGSLTREEARETVDGLREAFEAQAQSAQDELDALEERFPQFAALIQMAREELDRLAESPGDRDPETTGVGGFIEGFDDALENLAERANNTFTLAQNLVGSLVQSFTGPLVDAIEGVIRGTVSAGDAFRDFASQTLISLGRVIAQAVALQLLVIGLNAISPGLGSAIGAFAGAQALNDGGAVVRGDGGMGVVTGPDVGNRDSQLAALTVGEVVWSRPAVAQAGGPDRVMQAHNNLLRGLPAFNTGGIVGGGVAQQIAQSVSGGAGVAQGAAAGGGVEMPSAAMLDVGDPATRSALGRVTVPVMIRELGENPSALAEMRALIGGA